MSGSTRKPINHGTNGGYVAHYRRGEPMCDPCRAAHYAVNVVARAKIITCRDCGRECHNWSTGRCQPCYKRRQANRTAKRKRT
jgi:hypothetical protein